MSNTLESPTLVANKKSFSRSTTQFNKFLSKSMKNVNMQAQEDKSKQPLAQVTTPRHQTTSLMRMATSDNDQMKLPLLVLPKDIMMYTSPIQTPSQPFIPFSTLVASQRDRDIISHTEPSFIMTDTDTKKKPWEWQLMFNKWQQTEYHEVIEKENQKLCDDLVKSINKKITHERNMIRVKTYPSKRLLEPHTTSKPLEEKKSPMKKSSTRTFKYQNFTSQSIKLFWYVPNDYTVWRPEVREGASLTVTDRYGYLFGGSSKELFEDMEIIDTSNLHWQRAKPAGEFPREGRMGHTSNLYKGNIIIFGGEKGYNTTTRCRICLNDMKMFLTEAKEWKGLRCFDTITPRRNHVAVVVGKYLIVHGGIDSLGNYLSDLAALNFGNMKWTLINEKGNDGIGFAFHTACLVINVDRIEIGLYKAPIDLKYNDNSISNYKYEGIYMFGGKNADGDILSSLRILKIGQKPVEWIFPEVNGQGPAARYQHTMSYSKHLGIIIIYGGRNDKMAERVFNDIFLLELCTLTWMNVQYIGDEGIPRYSHVSGMFGHRMLVFGGLGQRGLVGSQVHILELDPDTVKKFEKERLIFGSSRAVPSISKINQEYVVTDDLNPINKQYQEQYDYLKKFENLLTYAPKPNKVELQHGGVDILGFISRKEEKINLQIQGNKKAL